MAMPLSACFDYVVTVPGAGAPWQAEQHPDDVAAREQMRRRVPRCEPELIDPFLGPKPAVEIAGGTVTLASSMSLEIDAAMVADLRRGDMLRLMRTGCGGLGVAILRRSGTLRRTRLIAAAGAVAGRAMPPLTIKNVRQVPGDARDAPWGEEGRVEIGIDGEARALGAGEETAFGDYGVVVVNGFKTGVPGTDECVAVFALGEPLRDAVLASARLLASRGLRGTPTSKWAAPG